jgi:hypothetical protein
MLPLTADFAVVFLHLLAGLRARAHPERDQPEPLPDSLRHLRGGRREERRGQGRNLPGRSRSGVGPGLLPIRSRPSSQSLFRVLRTSSQSTSSSRLRLGAAATTASSARNQVLHHLCACLLF